jgi:hypothetical protein
MSVSRSMELQGLYGALLGGMIASFGAVVAFSYVSGGGRAVMTVVLFGLGTAIALMVGGLLASDKRPWLGNTLLFAAGFTTLWAVATSFTVDQKWAVLLALGVAIAIGMAVGARRFSVGPGMPTHSDPTV